MRENKMRQGDYRLVWKASLWKLTFKTWKK